LALPGTSLTGTLILTLDAGKWRQHSQDLDEPLHIIEIADPDEPAG
jgi:hypothetical protein